MPHISRAARGSKTRELSARPAAAMVVKPNSSPLDPNATALINSIKLAHLKSLVTNDIPLTLGKPQIDGIIEKISDTPKMHPKGVIAEAPMSDIERYFLNFLKVEDVGTSWHAQKGTLPPNGSILCLRDQIRSKKFLQAIQDAVNEQVKSKDEIQVLDAGCGAIPAMSIYAALCSSKVKCTAVELNHESAAIARTLVKRLGLENQINVIQADATKYIPKKEVDILVSETMNSALLGEPLVEIMQHLKKFTANDAICLPSKVTVKAALVSKRDFEGATKAVTFVQKPFAVCDYPWQARCEYIPGQKLDKICLKIDTKDLDRGYYHVVLSSDVELGPNHRLGDFQSQISCPRVSFISLPDGQRIPEAFMIYGNQARRMSGGEDQIVEISYPPGATYINTLH